MPLLFKKLNETLRGWGNYHRHVVAWDTFVCVDTYVKEQLWRMVRRRHPKKSRTWLHRHYWQVPGHNWVFTTAAKSAKGQLRHYKLVRLKYLGIKRHIKIKADAKPRRLCLSKLVEWLTTP